MFAQLYELLRLSVLFGLDIVGRGVTLFLNRGGVCRTSSSSSSLSDSKSNMSITGNGGVGSNSNGSGNFFTESGFSSSRSALCDVLRSLIINNIEYFQTDRSILGVRFTRVFCRFLESLNEVESGANEVGRCAHRYDLDAKTPGNGYRSQVAVVDSCIMQCIHVCRTMCVQRGSFLFRKEHYLREVEAYADMLGCLRILLVHLKTLKARSAPTDLFPEPGLSSTELLLEAENIETTCFYGRCLGFQFCESMKKPLKFISIMMASFSDAYYNTGSMVARTASSLVSCGKYAYNPEARAKRIVEVSQKASVDFCKAFWLLQETELLKTVPDIVCPSVPVNKVIQIPAEPMELPTLDGGSVSIPIPSSHLRPAPVICRLLSSSVREGQLSDSEATKVHAKVLPTSPYLIIQCHGGGFVAQSSKSHEVYLRDWATQLDVPFLCIDYSLAPQAPYPRALEECLYAYAWALKNAHRLGSTGEKICLVGDSAGGNLMMGVTLKAIELGIRKPDGVYILYTPLLIDFVPSPSRLLCIMDPMLPFGFMMRCLKAYAGQPTSEGSCADGDVSPPSDSIGPASPTCSSNASLASTPSHERPQSPHGFCSEPATSAELVSGQDETDQPPVDVPVDVLVALDDDNNNPPANSIDDDQKELEKIHKEESLASIQTISEQMEAPTISARSTTESFVEVTAADLLELTSSSTSRISSSDVSGVSTSGVTSSLGSIDSSTWYANGAVVVDNAVSFQRRQGEEDYVRDFMDWYVLDKMEAKDAENEADAAAVTRLPLRSESSEMEENVLFELPMRKNLTRRMTSITDAMISGLSGTLKLRRKSQPSMSTGGNGAVVGNSSSATTLLDGRRSNQAPVATNAVTAPVVKKPKKTDGIFANRYLADGGTVGSVILEFEKFKVNGSDPYQSPYLASDEVLRQLPKLGFLSLQLDPCLDDSIMFCKRLRKLGNEFQIDILDSLPHGFLNFAMLSKDAHDASRLCVQRLRELLSM